MSVFYLICCHKIVLQHFITFKFLLYFLSKKNNVFFIIRVATKPGILEFDNLGLNNLDFEKI